MLLKEFICKFVEPTMQEEYLVERMDESNPFGDFRNVSALVQLNIPEKSWLNHEVLMVYPMLFTERNEYKEIRRARIRILISSMERK